jgi:hypothetical protein
MIEKIVGFFGQVALYASSLFLVWIFVLGITYAVMQWCIKKEMPILKIISWISLAVLDLFITLIIFHMLPDNLQTVLTTIVVPHALCAFVLHACFLVIDRFFYHHFGQGMIHTRLVFIIIAVYIVLCLVALFLLHNQSSFILKISTIAVGYVTQIGLLILLTFEILAGRCTHKTIQEIGNHADDGNWL